MQNVAVVFGGKACEHDISIITALQLINSINENYNVIPIYVTKEGEWFYSKEFTTIDNVLNFSSKGRKCAIHPSDNSLYVKAMFGFKNSLVIDVVIIAMHGMNGEDGMVRAVCDMSGIPCINSGILPSSLAMNKCMFKKFLASYQGINVVRSLSYNTNTSIEEFLTKLSVSELKFPLILKPARLGSSIGIVVAKDIDELREKIIYASRFDNDVLVEEKIQNYKEYNIAVYRSRGGLVVSDIEEPIGADEILSYSDKYLSGSKSSGMVGARRIFPAKISKRLNTEINRIVNILYNDLGLQGVVRFDFLYDKDSKVLYLNELNTVPGSYAHYLFSGKKFIDIIDDMISMAYFAKQKEDQLIQYFSSFVLKSGVSGIKK